METEKKSKAGRKPYYAKFSTDELNMKMAEAEAEMQEELKNKNFSEVTKISAEIEKIQKELNSRTAPPVSAGTGISMEALSDTISSAVSSAIAQSMKAQAELISQAILKSQKDEIATLKNEIATLKAEIASLKATHNQVEKNLNNGNNLVDADDIKQKNTSANKASDSDSGSYKAKKKGATAQFRDAKKDFINGVAKEYDDMSNRQSSTSLVFGWVSKYPTWDSIPEAIRNEILEASEDNNDIYDVIASNMHEWEARTREEAMRGATDNPTDEQISHIDESRADAEASDIGSLDEFETILSNADDNIF